MPTIRPADPFPLNAPLLARSLASRSPPTRYRRELGALAAKLVRGPIPHLSCGTVALAALECAVRYARVLPSDPALISAALDLFLLRGLASPSEIVSTRACYLFMRIAKALRGPLRPHLADILPRLHSHMDVTLRTPPASDSAAPSPHGRAPAVPGVGGGASGGLPSATDNRLYVFEAVGYLLGQDAIPQGDQEVLVTAIVDRISRQGEAPLSLPLRRIGA